MEVLTLFLLAYFGGKKMDEYFHPAFSFIGVFILITVFWSGFNFYRVVKRLEAMEKASKGG